MTPEERIADLEKELAMANAWKEQWAYLAELLDKTLAQRNADMIRKVKAFDWIEKNRATIDPYKQGLWDVEKDYGELFTAPTLLEAVEKAMKA